MIENVLEGSFQLRMMFAQPELHLMPPLGNCHFLHQSLLETTFSEQLTETYISSEQTRFFMYICIALEVLETF